MTSQHTKPAGLFYIFAVVTAVVAIFSAVLMTEPGQSLNLPRSWLITYYENRWLMIGVTLALLVILWVLHLRVRRWRNVWMYLASAGVLLCLVAANFMLPVLFPSYQYGANYVSVEEADAILEDEDIIYSVAIKGEVRGFPRKHVEIPHIAGAEIGGENVVMTYCGLSNLPVVYDQDIGYGESDLRILIQTHNNLVMVDRESGEIVQQITGELEFSGTKLNTYANDMMTWNAFKRLYPDAEVFVYEFNRLLDRFLRLIFEGPLQLQYSEEHGPLFPTLDLTDTRLPDKEQVWGVDLGNAQAAFTLDFVRNNPIHQFELGGRQLVIVYDPEFEIVTLFSRDLDGTVIDVTEIDHQGNTPTGKLERVPMHNGVLWMVWAHWFPNTEVYG